MPLVLRLIGAVLLAQLLLPFSGARAADEIEVSVSIKDHKFEPAEIKVPAGKAVKLTVHNQDTSAEEFESTKLGVEKIIKGKASAIVRLKPLDKGSYPFVGEFHEDSAKGVIIAE